MNRLMAWLRRRGWLRSAPVRPARRAPRFAPRAETLPAARDALAEFDRREQLLDYRLREWRQERAAERRGLARGG